MKKLMVLLTIMVLAGCGKANNLLAPHQNVITPPTQTPPGSGKPQMQMQLQAAPQLADAPVTGDPLFAVFADDWQKMVSIGTIDSTGHITGTSTIYVDGFGEDHSMRLVFTRVDPMSGKTIRYPFMGDVHLNGTLLTAIDQGNPNDHQYNQWFKFIATRADTNHSTVVVSSPRDDSGSKSWTEIVATGVDTGSIDDSLAVAGNRRMLFASTFSSLEELPGIFYNDSWKGIVMAMKGQDFIFRAVDESNGRLLARGVYMKNPDGGLVLCTNLFDLDTGSGFFPAYIMHCNDDGTWSNLRNVDERPGAINIGVPQN